MDTVCVRIPGNTKEILRLVAGPRRPISDVVREGISFALVRHLRLFPLYISLCSGSRLTTIPKFIRGYAVHETVGTGGRSREIEFKVSVNGVETTVRVPCLTTLNRGVPSYSWVSR